MPAHGMQHTMKAKQEGRGGPIRNTCILQDGTPSQKPSTAQKGCRSRLLKNAHSNHNPIAQQGNRVTAAPGAVMGSPAAKCRNIHVAS